MAASIKWVGLDVHARQTRLALFEQRTGELSSRRVPGPASAVVDALVGLGPGVRAVYEAGPTGFALARAAAEHGLELRVCAPGSIARSRPIGSRPTAPTRSGSRVCSPPATSPSCACRRSRRSGCATSSGRARTYAVT